MTPDRIQAVATTLIDLRRHMLETQVRLKALEASIVESLPPEKREAWYARLEALMRDFRQQALESVEDASPSLAARLDDRRPEDLPDHP